MTRHALTPLLMLLLAALPAMADDLPSFQLTTDTPQYCTQLAKQVGDRHSAIADVQRVLAEGRDMCDRGETRGGIRRLRRALVILHHRKLAPKDATAKPGAPKDQGLKTPAPPPPRIEGNVAAPPAPIPAP
jgi:hypothetical protein